MEGEKGMPVSNSDDERRSRQRRLFGLDQVSGTTVAVASLAILGAAALVTAPIWLWYRGKRKRADALLRQSAAAAEGQPEPGKANGLEGDRSLE